MTDVRVLMVTHTHVRAFFVSVCLCYCLSLSYLSLILSVCPQSNFSRESTTNMSYYCISIMLDTHIHKATHIL